MNNGLLIVGAGAYGRVAKEIAESTKHFDKIAFVDDNAVGSFGGTCVVGKPQDLESLAEEYSNVIVAIGNPVVRLSMLETAEALGKFNIPVLISPFAYVSPSAKIDKGSIIGPMAVVHTESELRRGCIIAAGAVVNHGAICLDGVHVDCNAVVMGNVTVPEKTKVIAGRSFP